MRQVGRMLSNHEVEELNGLIQHLDREAVAERLRTFKASFPLDFTNDFFAREPLPKLRHILFGLCLHSQTMIEA